MRLRVFHRYVSKYGDWQSYIKIDFKEKPRQFLDGKDLLAFADPSRQFKDQVEKGKFVSDIVHWWRHLRHKMDVMVCRHLLSCQTKVELYKENILFFLSNSQMPSKFRSRRKGRIILTSGSAFSEFLEISTMSGIFSPKCDFYHDMNRRYIYSRILPWQKQK